MLLVSKQTINNIPILFDILFDDHKCKQYYNSIQNIPIHLLFNFFKKLLNQNSGRKKLISNSNSNKIRKLRPDDNFVHFVIC